MTLAYDAVSSSNIRAIVYHDGAGYVEFHSGRRFAYEMPRKLFDDMRAAKSIGSFFAKNVKGQCRVRSVAQRCSASPCPNDATKEGVVGGIRFFVCDGCSTAKKLDGIKLVPISIEAR